MAVDASRGSMVSRSVRLHEDTLKRLEERAEQEGKGVTVLMRDVLELYLQEPQQFMHFGAIDEINQPLG